MHYTLNDLDKEGLLKPNIVITVLVLFLCRQFFYGPISLVASRKTRASSGANIDMSFLEINSLWEFAACVPAALVLLALFRRKPDASNAIRYIWSCGKTLLLCGAAIQVAALLTGLSNNLSNMPTATIVLIMLHLYIIFHLFRSQRIRDTFAAFPQ